MLVFSKQMRGFGIIRSKAKRKRIHSVFITLLTLAICVNVFSVPVFAADEGDGFDRDNADADKIREQGYSYRDQDIEATFANALVSASRYRDYIFNDITVDNVNMSNTGLPDSFKNYDTEDKDAIVYVGEFFGYIPSEIGGSLRNPTLKTSEDLDAQSQGHMLNELANVSKSAPHYVAYGYALQSVGLDNVGTNTDDGFRSVFGPIAYFVFLGTMAIQNLFRLMFSVIKAFNPFQFFEKVVSPYGYDWASNLSSTVSNTDAALGELEISGALDGIRLFFGQIFSLFLDMGLTVMIPLSLILFIAGFFLMKSQRQEAGNNLKKIIIKIAFLVIGIPVIGSTYTQLLDSLEDTAVVNNDFVAYTVASTFVDFEAWAYEANLAPIAIDGTSFKAMYISSEDKTKAIVAPHYDTWRNLRKIAVTINSTYSGLTPATEEVVIGEMGASLKRDMTDTGNQITYQFCSTLDSESADYDETMSHAQRLIKSFMEGRKITAPAFATALRGNLGSSSRVADMFYLSSLPVSFSTDDNSYVTGLPSGDGVKTDLVQHLPTLQNNVTKWSEIAERRFGSGMGFKIKEDGSGSGTGGHVTRDPIINFWDDGGMTSVMDGEGVI